MDVLFGDLPHPPPRLEQPKLATFRLRAAAFPIYVIRARRWRRVTDGLVLMWERVAKTPHLADAVAGLTELWDRKAREGDETGPE
jgi:hypothetical protein